MADGFEDGCVGVVRQFNRYLALYDYAKCVEVLVQRDGMSYPAATDWMEVNVLGAYMGPDTPVFSMSGDDDFY